MITVDQVTFAMVLRALSESCHSEAKEASNRMRIAAVEAMAREIEFNNEVPALCRAQAG